MNIAQKFAHVGDKLLQGRKKKLIAGAFILTASIGGAMLGPREAAGILTVVSGTGLAAGLFHTINSFSDKRAKTDEWHHCKCYVKTATCALLVPVFVASMPVTIASYLNTGTPFSYDPAKARQRVMNKLTQNKPYLTDTEFQTRGTGNGWEFNVKPFKCTGTVHPSKPLEGHDTFSYVTFSGDCETPKRGAIARINGQLAKFEPAE